MLAFKFLSPILGLLLYSAVPAWCQTPAAHDQKYTYSQWYKVGECHGINFYFETSALPGPGDKVHIWVKAENTNNFHVSFVFGVKIVSKLGSVYEQTITGSPTGTPLGMRGLNPGTSVEFDMLEPFPDNDFAAQWGVTECYFRNQDAPPTGPTGTYENSIMTEHETCADMQAVPAPYPFFEGAWNGTMNNQNAAKIELNVQDQAAVLDFFTANGSSSSAAPAASNSFDLNGQSVTGVISGGAITVVPTASIPSSSSASTTQGESSPSQTIVFSGTIDPTGKLAATCRFGSVSLQLTPDQADDTLTGSGTWTSNTPGIQPMQVTVQLQKGAGSSLPPPILGAGAAALQRAFNNVMATLRSEQSTSPKAAAVVNKAIATMRQNEQITSAVGSIGAAILQGIDDRAAAEEQQRQTDKATREQHTQDLRAQTTPAKEDFVGAFLAPIHLIQTWVQNGADINAQNGDGDTLLSMSIGSSPETSVEWLLKHGANIYLTDTNGDSAAEDVIESNQMPLVLSMLQNGLDVHRAICPHGSAIDVAKQSYKDIQMLIKSYGNTRSKIGSEVSMLTTPDADAEALAETARIGQHLGVKRALDSGTPVDAPDEFGLTPLMNAMMPDQKQSTVFGNDYAEVVRLLVESGARLNTTNILGQTPLILAARNLDPTVADPARPGATMLDVIGVLLSHRADPTIKDYCGMTAFDWATFRSQTDPATWAPILSLLGDAQQLGGKAAWARAISTLATAPTGMTDSQLQKLDVAAIMCAPEMDKMYHDWVDAEQGARDCVLFAPTNAETYELLAEVFAAEGKCESSVETARKAIQLDQNGPDHYNTLAKSLLALGDTDDARTNEQTSIQLQRAATPGYTEWDTSLLKKLSLSVDGTPLTSAQLASNQADDNVSWADTMAWITQKINVLGPISLPNKADGMVSYKMAACTTSKLEFVENRVARNGNQHTGTDIVNFQDLLSLT